MRNIFSDVNILWTCKMKLNQTFLDRKAGVVAIAAGTMLSVFKNHLLYLGDHLGGLPSLLSTVIEILWIGFIVWICIVSTSTISANIAQDTFKEFNSNNAREAGLRECRIQWSCAASQLSMWFQLNLGRHISLICLWRAIQRRFDLRGSA